MLGRYSACRVPIVSAIVLFALRSPVYRTEEGHRLPRSGPVHLDFPLPPGSSHTYKGQEVDPDTGETVETDVHERTSPVPQETAGVPVTEIEVREYNDSQLVETTSDYHAQSLDGSVLYRGEHINQYDNGQLVGHEGTWIAGEGANQAGELMPATPVPASGWCAKSVPTGTPSSSRAWAVDHAPRAAARPATAAAATWRPAASMAIAARPPRASPTW